VEAFFKKFYQLTGRHYNYEEMKMKVSDFMKRLLRNGNTGITLDDVLDYFHGYRRSFEQEKDSENQPSGKKYHEHL